MTGRLSRQAVKRESDGALSWKEYVRIVKTQSPDFNRGLNRYQVLGKLTSQTRRERYEVCWKQGSKLEGQQAYQKIHNSVCLEDPCSSELWKVTRARIWKHRRFLTQTLRKEGVFWSFFWEGVFWCFVGECV